MKFKRTGELSSPGPSKSEEEQLALEERRTPEVEDVAGRRGPANEPVQRGNTQQRR